MSLPMDTSPEVEENPPDTAARGSRDWASGAVLAVLATFAMVMSWQLGLTRGDSPGPGLWPFLCGGLLLACAAGVALGPVPAPEDPDTEFRPVLLISAVGLMFAFIVLLTTLGVVTATVVVGFTWLRFIAAETWRLSIALALAVGLIVYMVFIVALDIPLPLDVFLPR